MLESQVVGRFSVKELVVGTRGRGEPIAGKQVGRLVEKLGGLRKLWLVDVRDVEGMLLGGDNLSGTLAGPASAVEADKPSLQVSSLSH